MTGSGAAFQAVDSLFGGMLSGLTTLLSGSLGGWITFIGAIAIAAAIFGIVMYFVHRRK